ncbi:MAG: hypothetical protein GTN99_11295 [Candidatus Dadabacteria bacterium]|nr:hypothetical protein [Candidatus Dadabacteria bacterium]
MAAGAWTFYNKAKEYIGDATIDLDTDNFRMSLYISSSNAATATLTALSQVTNQVAEANGYSSSGKALAGVTWATGASASEMRFDATANVWTAAGGNISAIQFAVIWASGGNLVCYSQLSTAPFSVSDGNTLTITPSANGIFELN